MSQEKLEEIIKFANLLLDARVEVQHHIGHPVDKYFADKIDEWASKILGISNGYQAEFLQMYKHRVQKGRTLWRGHGDVTVGEPDDLHASTIQLKSTISQTATDVNTMIKVALNQLSGERGENPRDGDRLIVDMTIHNPENTWPGGAGSLGHYDWVAYEDEAMRKIKLLCESYRPHTKSNKQKRGQDGYGLSQAAIQSLSDTTNRQLYNVHALKLLQRPNSSQVVAHQWGHNPNDPERIKHLTIKIRYPHGYPIRGSLSQENCQYTYFWLAMIAFNVFRVGDQLMVRYSRHKSYLA